MSAFTQGLQFGFAQGMFNNMFGFGGFGRFWGNPFGCCCMPFNMPPLFMVPRFNFTNLYTYPTVTPQVNLPVQAYNISPLDFSAPNIQTFNNIQVQPPVIDTQNYTAIGDTFVRETVKTHTGTSVSDNEKKYDDLIIKYANKYNVDVDLIRAVIKQESSFNPNAKSKAGAMGLMQLMPNTAKGYGVTNPFDPEQNIEAGVHMLSDLSKKYNGDKKMILAAYNWGSGNLAKKRV